jgi:recombination protein RecT
METNGTNGTAVERAKDRVAGIVKQGKFAGAKSEDIVTVLSRFETQIAQALPKAAKDLSAQRIIQIAATIISGNEKLKECDMGSVIGAVMQAAILGLNPMPTLAEVYFVPFHQSVKVNGKWQKKDKPDCQMQIGYKGFVNIYHRGRFIGSVTCGAVAKGDDFDYALGTSQFLRHIPTHDVEPNGSNLRHAWALARYNNGHEVFVVLTKAQIERLRRRSPMAQYDPEKLSGGWEKDYAAMAMAKALKQLKRTIPTDASIDAAFATDEAVLRPDTFRNDQSGEIDFSKLERADDTLAAIEEASVVENVPVNESAPSENDAKQSARKPSEVRTGPNGEALFEEVEV